MVKLWNKHKTVVKKDNYKIIEKRSLGYDVSRKTDVNCYGSEFSMIYGI